MLEHIDNWPISSYCIPVLCWAKYYGKRGKEREEKRREGKGAREGEEKS